jgi:Protein of unknown function (DUF4238)
VAQLRNHHFVPQFYLRTFGIGNSVAVYNLDRSLLVPRASIAGQAQKSRLYGKDASVEVALSDLERDVAPIIRRAIQKQELPTGPSKEDASLLYFISYQWRRTPAAGDEVETFSTKMAQAVLRFAPNIPGDAKEAIPGLRIKHENPVLFSMGIAGSLGPLLADLWKCLLVNRSPIEFITSDAPVVLHNMWAESVTHMGTTGFASAGLQLLYPLSPRHLLLMQDRDVYAFGCKQSPRVVEIRDAADVDALNAMQLSVANQNLYFSGDRATMESIDRLPRDWRQGAEKTVVVRRAVDNEGTSQIVHTFRRSSAKLRMSKLRILKKAASIPPADRGRLYRPRALEMNQLVRGRHDERYRAPSSAGPWLLVDDEK